MSATLIGNNVTLKVNAAVSSTSTTTGTKYTAPSNGYAIVHISFVGGSSTGQITINLAGNSIYSNPSIASSTTSQTIVTALYVGPSQALAVGSNGISASINIMGVEFVNSP